MARRGWAFPAFPPIRRSSGDARGGADVRRQGLNARGRWVQGGVLKGGAVNDRAIHPIFGGVGLSQPMESLMGGASAAASLVARRPQLFPVSGGRGNQRRRPRIEAAGWR